MHNDKSSRQAQTPETHPRSNTPPEIVSIQPGELFNQSQKDKWKKRNEMKRKTYEWASVTVLWFINLK